MNDKSVVWLVIASLASLAIISVLGVIVLAFFGKPEPSVLPTTIALAGGAIAGILAKTTTSADVVKVVQHQDVANG